MRTRPLLAKLFTQLGRLTAANNDIFSAWSEFTNIPSTQRTPAQTLALEKLRSAMYSLCEMRQQISKLDPAGQRTAICDLPADPDAAWLVVLERLLDLTVLASRLNDSDVRFMLLHTHLSGLHKLLKMNAAHTESRLAWHNSDPKKKGLMVFLHLRTKTEKEMADGQT